MKKILSVALVACAILFGLTALLPSSALAATDADLTDCIENQGYTLEVCCQINPELQSLSRCSAPPVTPPANTANTNYNKCIADNDGENGDPVVKATCCAANPTATACAAPPYSQSTYSAGAGYTQATYSAGAGYSQSTYTAGAGGVTCEKGYTFKNGLCIPDSSSGGLAATDSLGDLLVKIINMLLTLGGIVAVLFIVIGGYWYITAAGNAEQAEKGRAALTNAIIGVVLILMSYAIVNVVSKAITKSV